jgi:hypothetical protein
MPGIFKTKQDRLNAEALLRNDAKEGSWTAAGYGLMIDRLDSLLGRMDRLIERHDAMIERQDKLIAVLAKVAER